MCSSIKKNKCDFLYSDMMSVCAHMRACIRVHQQLFHGCNASLWFLFTGSHSTGAKQNKNMFRDLSYIAAVVSFFHVTIAYANMFLKAGNLLFSDCRFYF
jgi:hypothetical protein